MPVVGLLLLLVVQAASPSPAAPLDSAPKANAGAVMDAAAAPAAIEKNSLRVICTVTLLGARGKRPRSPYAIPAAPGCAGNITRLALLPTGRYREPSGRPSPAMARLRLQQACRFCPGKPLEP